jgi:hypothetical protein
MAEEGCGGDNRYVLDAETVECQTHPALPAESKLHEHGSCAMAGIVVAATFPKRHMLSRFRLDIDGPEPLWLTGRPITEGLTLEKRERSQSVSLMPESENSIPDDVRVRFPSWVKRHEE